MPAFKDVPVVQSALGQNSRLVGAAALAFLATDPQTIKPCLSMNR